MAKNAIPDPLTRRHLVEKEQSEKEALALAEAYLVEERVVDALVFFEKAGALERLAELAEKAVSGGDAFLLREISRHQGVEPEAETWARLAEAAVAAGRELDAHTARRQAGLPDEA